MRWTALAEAEALEQLTAQRGSEPREPDTRIGGRRRPWLLVHVEGPDADERLTWALREVARRDAPVVAVAVVNDEAGPRRRAAMVASLEARVLRATVETGVHGRSRTALLDPVVFDALAGVAGGADLVVRQESKAVLRHALPRPRPRRVICAP